MGKRTNFERNPRDYYPTPYRAVLPLFKHLPCGSSFVEPCAGDGRLVDHLESHGNICTYACDIEPQKDRCFGGRKIQKEDVLFFGWKCPPADFIITNPPWERNMDGTGPLHEMINIFRVQAPTWLLFDSDWMFTGQANPFLKYCRKIVTVGRVSWMENGVSGMDNCCWYLFQKEECETIFF